MSDQFSILSRLLMQSSQRQGVLASNIANVDTPDYKSKDVKFEDSLNAELSMAKTSPNHIASENSSSGTVTTDNSKPWVDGNTVELDQEVAKMTENAMLYQAGVQLLSTKIQMFKKALNTQ